MRRFFFPQKNILKLNAIVEISDDNYQHWCKALRAKLGDMAVFFDGQGGEYTAKLISIDKKSAQIELLEFNPINRTNPYHTTLIQALSQGDKMDYTIQKACEMGVSRIKLITTERSDYLRYERDQKKLVHWQKIAISSCEQCGLNLVPEILAPIPLAQALKEDDSELKLVLDFEKTAQPASLPNTISLLIGAEGGLSERELELAKAHNFVGLHLGERILRTETAGVVAMATLAHIYHCQ